MEDRSMNRALMLAPILLALSIAPALAQSGDRCFSTRDFDSWRAQDAKTVFIRVNQARYFRLDLGAACPRIMQKNVHLIMNTSGSDQICSAVDWQLKVADTGPGNIATPCIVKTMTPLSKAEADAIPKEFKP
jgi:hypothetical protein